MRNNKSLMTIFLIVFIDLFGFGIILPLLPYIAEKYSANPLQIGLLTATYSFFQLIGSPILGRLSDRYGRKNMLIISQIGTALGFIVLGLANNLTLLFVSRIIDGITGGNISIAQAYIADVTDKKNRARGMGLIGAAFGLGFIFGPAIGGALSKYGYSTPAFFAATISVITVLTTIFFLKETINEKKASLSLRTRFSIKEFKRVLSLYPMGILIIVFFLLNTAFSMMQGTLALWTERTYHFTPQNNGFLFAYIGILGVIFQLIVLPRLVKIFPEKRLLKIATFVLFIGLLLIPIFPSLLFLYIAMIFIALGNGMANPSIQALASENVPKDEYGATLGFLQSAGSLGRIIGPVFGGEFFMIIGKDFVLYAGASIVLFVWVYLSLRLR